MYYNFRSPQCINDFKTLIASVQQVCQPFSSFIILSYNCGYGTNLLKEEYCKFSDPVEIVYNFIANWVYHYEAEDTESSPINIWYKSESDDTPFFISSSLVYQRDNDDLLFALGASYILGWLFGQILNATDIYFYKKHNLIVNYVKQR